MFSILFYFANYWQFLKVAKMDVWDLCSIIFTIIMIAAFSKIVLALVDGFLFAGRYEISKTPCFIIATSLASALYANYNSKYSILAYCAHKVLQFKDWFAIPKNKLFLILLVIVVITMIVIISSDSIAAQMAAMFSIVIYLCVAMTVMCSIIKNDSAQIESLVEEKGLDNAVIELYAGDVSVLKIAELTDKTPKEIYKILRDNDIYN